MTRDDIEELLELSSKFAEVLDRPIPKVPTLRGRTVVNAFFEDSTRTRLSFETAAKRLSADVMSFSTKGSSVDKGESLRDTVETLEAMGVDAFVVRHSSSGAPWQVASWVGASVVNAGDGTHQHPTQALLDCYTIRQHLDSLDGRRIAIVGDIVNSRVARSDIDAFTLLGASVVVVAPPTLLPRHVATWPVEVSHELERAHRTGATLVLAFVDVDGLKQVNDSQGHLAGDALLRLVGETLRANVRPYDVIVRYGGDELLCAMSNLGVPEARARFEKIAAALAAADADHSITFGLAAAEPADGLQELIARADADFLEARNSPTSND